MAEKKTVVCGVYQNEEQAKRTVPDFLRAGFSNEAVSVSVQDNHGTKAPEGTGAGVTTGGALLSVHCDTSAQITLAEDLLKQTGAQDVLSSAEEAREIFVES
jgi:hypothetical protein